MKLEKNTRLIRNGFGTVFVLAAFILIASSHFVVFAQQASQPGTAPADISQFIGTWSAVHNGTPYSRSSFAKTTRLSPAEFASVPSP